MLAKAMARSIDCSFRRIQFTPDLLPTDITGVNVFNQERGDFEFRPGAVFANVVLGDEINRASPEDAVGAAGVMEERQVTVDTETPSLGTPFIVIATQNPIEHEGTYPAARGPARPVHDAAVDGLPGPRRRDRDPRDAQRASRSTSSRRSATRWRSRS